jgi:hypothetical protein
MRAVARIGPKTTRTCANVHNCGRANRVNVSARGALLNYSTCSVSNHCTLTQCANDGICRNRPDRATCDCAQGWGGDNCTIACPSSRCVNGGKCIVRNEQTSIQYGCECVAGYTGERCETGEGTGCADAIHISRNQRMRLIAVRSRHMYGPIERIHVFMFGWIHGSHVSS